MLGWMLLLSENMMNRRQKWPFREWSDGMAGGDSPSGKWGWASEPVTSLTSLCYVDIAIDGVHCQLMFQLSSMNILSYICST